MGSAGAAIPRTIQLARVLEEDIQRRGLRPGDPFDDTAETARRLQVSTSAANRALQLLAQRGVLQRRQRVGTFIAKEFGRLERAALRCIHLLVHRDYLKQEGLLADGTVAGLQRELPGAHVQFNFLPAGDGVEFVSQLVSEVAHRREPEGFVLVRAPLGVQRLIASSGLPAVVDGTLYPTVQGLAWVDRDQAQIGRVLAEHLIAQGHRRILVIMRERLAPGDHLTLDAIQGALAVCRNGRAPGLTLRCLPSDRTAIVEDTARVLAGPAAPTGIICRSRPIAEAALEAAASLTGDGQGIGICVCDQYDRPGFVPRFACAQAQTSPLEQGRIIGRMLAQQVAGRRPQPAVHLIPVRLVLPTPPVSTPEPERKPRPRRRGVTVPQTL